MQIARRDTPTKGPSVSTDDESWKLLGELDLAIYNDLICSLPYILDPELRERIRSAGTMANACFNLRAVGPGGTDAEFSRAIIEVQRYFKWLRWNLTEALAGAPLPTQVVMPDVRRPIDAHEDGVRILTWELPPGVPEYT
jgi:hypothetical protein